MKLRLSIIILALLLPALAIAVTVTGPFRGITTTPAVPPTTCANNMDFSQACSTAFLGAL